jgi:hypothetical protein
VIFPGRPVGVVADLSQDEDLRNFFACLGCSAPGSSRPRHRSHSATTKPLQTSEASQTNAPQIHETTPATAARQPSCWRELRSGPSDVVHLREPLYRQAVAPDQLIGPRLAVDLSGTVKAGRGASRSRRRLRRRAPGQGHPRRSAGSSQARCLAACREVPRQKGRLLCALSGRTGGQRGRPATPTSLAFCCNCQSAGRVSRGCWSCSGVPGASLAPR